jgi:hypothetical protein
MKNLVVEKMKENMIEKHLVSEVEDVMSKDEIGNLKKELSLESGVYLNYIGGKVDKNGETFCEKCVDEGRGKQSTKYVEEQQQYECTKCVAFVRIPKIKNQKRNLVFC